MNEQAFERMAETARKRIEETIAEVAGELAGQGAAALPALMWAVASGTVTAAGHTLSLIVRETPDCDVSRMMDALKAQLADSYDQAVAMRAH
jgi:hypothetical protein